LFFGKGVLSLPAEKNKTIYGGILSSKNYKILIGGGGDC
jgi:hypothetical protein